MFHDFSDHQRRLVKYVDSKSRFSHRSIDHGNDPHGITVQAEDAQPMEAPSLDLWNDCVEKAFDAEPLPYNSNDARRHSYGINDPRGSMANWLVDWDTVQMLNSEAERAERMDVDNERSPSVCSTDVVSDDLQGYF